MATMYPQSILQNTKSSAERKLFSLFKNELPNEYTVFHSVAWLARGQDNKAYDGETDFLVAHPRKGLLVIEVKGGRIEYSGQTGIWSSVDRNNEKYVLSKDPVEQAKNARYNLYRKLKNSPSTSRNHFPVFHAVCFPDIVVEQDLRLDLPRAIVLDRIRINNLAQSIVEIFSYWNQNKDQQFPTEEGINSLVDLIAPSIEITTPLGKNIEEDERQISLLTEEQFMALDLLSRERKAIIFGCAGSGKTLLAIEKARRLSKEGYSVLFTCFNAKLADWLSLKYGRAGGIKIANFHKLCVELVSRAGNRLPGINSEIVQGDQNYFFETILAQGLIDSVAKLGAQHNAIVVDEGQDFHSNWWVALDYLLFDKGNDIFYIFCDDNQNIYLNNEQNYPFLSPSLVLSKNCRTTKSIHKVVQEYYKGTIEVHASGPDGISPEFITYSTDNELVNQISKCLHTLVVEGVVNLSEIIILTPKSRENSILKQDIQLGNFSISWDASNKPSEIECSTIHSFKGLERAIVLLAEIPRSSSLETNNLLYVGTSRARSHLIIFLDQRG